MGRPVPLELRRMLLRAWQLEIAADTGSHRHVAIRGLSVLLLAASEAGWTAVELGEVIGMKRSTLNRRVNVERRRRDGAPTGLVVPSPPMPPLTPTQIRRLPVEQRDWFTNDEACAVAGVCSTTLKQWRTDGLLPHTWRASRTHFLYHRADLDRIARAPRRGKVGVDRAQVLADIAAGG